MFTKVGKFFKSLFNKKNNKSSGTVKVPDVQHMELEKKEKQSPIFSRKGSDDSKKQKLRRIRLQGKRLAKLRKETVDTLGTAYVPMRGFGNCRKLKGI